MGLKVKDKEEAVKLKGLRRELQEKINETLPGAGNKEIHVQVEKLDEALAIDETTAKRVVEALLFSTSKPMVPNEFKKVLKGYSPARVQKIIETLKEEYEKEERSFRVVEVGGGFEISTAPKYAPWIMKLELQKKARQATASALETLAILVYKQPVTRAEIEDIRGVNSSGMIATLLEKGFVKIVGRKEVPGRPMLYGTSPKFLEYFGLKSLSDLPDISEIKELVENAIRKEELLEPRETIIKDEEEIEGEINQGENEGEENVSDTETEENVEPDSTFGSKA